MKTLLQSLLILLLISAQCVSQDGKSTAQTKEQIKLQQQLVKNAEKQRKREEKERLKSPATVQITGSVDEIGSRIVQHMSSRNYKIAEEGKYRIVFTQEAKGFGGALYGGLMGAQGPPLRTLSFTISQFGDVTTVTIDISIQLRKSFGRVDRVDMNKNKEWRADVENFLYTLKYTIETQAKPK